MAGLAGLALLVVMFLPWFEQGTLCDAYFNRSPGSQVACGQLSVNAWKAFSVTDIFLAAAAIGGILAAILTAANTKPDAPITWEAVAVLGSFIAAALAVYRLLDPPGSLDRHYGAYLGAGAALLLLFGCWRAERDEYASPS